MKENNFEKILLTHQIVDYRNLYSIVAKKRALIPSFSIMVMGLNKDKLIFYKISTAYRLIKYKYEIKVDDIESMNIKNRRRDTVMELLVNKELKKYFVLEHNKDIYTIKKILKK